MQQAGLQAGGGGTYRAVEDAVPLVAAFLDMVLQRTRVERLEQFEAAQQLPGHGHDGAPVVEFAAVLSRIFSSVSICTVRISREQGIWGGQIDGKGTDVRC